MRHKRPQGESDEIRRFRRFQEIWHAIRSGDPVRFIELRRPAQITTNQDLVNEARRRGPIRVVRFDRDLGRRVEDVITADMPARELVS